MQVGTTKDQGLYNKRSTAVHPGALTAGTLPQYSTTDLLQVAPLTRNSTVQCLSYVPLGVRS